MKRYLRVAEHVFSIDCCSFEGLSNYSPFEICSDDGCTPVFALEVDSDSGRAFARNEACNLVYRSDTDLAEPRLDLYEDSGNWWVEMAPLQKMDPVAAMSMNSDFTFGKLTCPDARFLRFAVDNAAMILFTFRTSTMDTLSMHSSVVMKDGRAYMFLANSGVGKSTHSRMWLENIPGSELLNDDNPAVRLMTDGSVRVFGTPWSGKTPCYRNLSAELGAMVRIRRCAENRITPLNVAEAYASVLSSSSGFRPIESMAEGLHSTIAAVALRTPCFVLDCRPDAQAAHICYSGVCR